MTTPLEEQQTSKIIGIFMSMRKTDHVFGDDQSILGWQILPVAASTQAIAQDALEGFDKARVGGNPLGRAEQFHAAICVGVELGLRMAKEGAPRDGND